MKFERTAMEVEHSRLTVPPTFVKALLFYEIACIGFEPQYGIMII